MPESCSFVSGGVGLLACRRKKERAGRKDLIKKNDFYCVSPRGFPGKILVFTVVSKCKK